MHPRIVITKNARKDLQTLDGVIRARIGKKLLYFAGQPNPLDSIKHLTNSAEGTYRWRVGNYRIVFDVDGTTFVILRVQHRREMYR